MSARGIGRGIPAGVEVGLAIMQTMAVPTPSIAKLGAITLYTGFGTKHFACMRTHAVVILCRTVPSPLGWVGSRCRKGLGTQQLAGALGTDVTHGGTW